MKILVIQLTRLGDVLCTLPCLTALRRENPTAQIHFLVRKSFSEAASLSKAVDHFWYLDSEKLFSPIITDRQSKEASLAVLADHVDKLRREKFDLIINLSFSPSSSFVTHLISAGQTPTLGYSRTDDFFLHIPDEPSRYFRAQVGLDKSNRMHVVDLFAWIAGVKLSPSDIKLFGDEPGSIKSGVVCHLGASQVQKMWPAEYWLSLLRLLTVELKQQVVLVGGAKEKLFAGQIEKELSSAFVKNLVGESSLADLSEILKKSQLFIGVDSGPLHLASLSNCTALNLSVGNVRFWETGPLAMGSRVLVKQNPKYLTPDFVYNHAASMLTGNDDVEGAFITTSFQDESRYILNRCEKLDIDEWDFVRWLYFKGAKPEINPLLETALAQIVDASEIALKQTEVLFKNPKKVEISGILDRLDQVIGLIGQKHPELKPLTDDFFCEKSNIPPGTREEVFYQTDVCYRTLVAVALSLKTKNPALTFERTMQNDSRNI